MLLATHCAWGHLYSTQCWLAVTMLGEVFLAHGDEDLQRATVLQVEAHACQLCLQEGSQIPHDFVSSVHVLWCHTIPGHSVHLLQPLLVLL